MVFNFFFVLMFYFGNMSEANFFSYSLITLLPLSLFNYFFLPAIGPVFLPRLVLALVFVLWPLQGRPLLCLIPLKELISWRRLMFIVTSRLKSPSILNSDKALRNSLISSSVKSSVLKSGEIPVFSRIFLLLAGPIP